MCAHANVPEPTTADRVYDVVAGIPPCRVLTYGDVAELAGLGSARIVGRVLASGAEPVPWHRVVRADGSCAPHIRARQVALLRDEGMAMRGERVQLAEARFDPTRVERPVGALDPAMAERWLISSIVPRPVAWVSTRSAAGVDRLAAHSITVVDGAEPPTVCFTTTEDDPSLLAARETGEFVVCVGTEPMLAALNESATEFPADASTFELVGVHREPSAMVRPPRVANTPVAFECRLSGEYAVGGRVLVFGEVIHIAATRGVLADDGLPDPVMLAPLARLGRNQWWRGGQLFTLDEIDWPAWQRGVRSAEPRVDPRAG